MRAFGWLTGIVLLVIAAGVAITAATAQALPAPTSPTGAAQSYMALFQSGDCAQGAFLLPQDTSLVDCPQNLPITSVTATAKRVPNFCRSYGCRRSWTVSVTYTSDGPVSYSPHPPPIHFPVTVRSEVFVGQMANGGFTVFPAPLVGPLAPGQ